MKKVEMKKEPSPNDLNRLLDWVSDHPLAQKIIKEKRQKIRKRRRSVIEEIQNLERDHGPKVRDLITERDGAEASWKKAREPLSKAEFELVHAKEKLYDEQSLMSPMSHHGKGSCGKHHLP